tara:strand:+ start:84 stop:440 length:357 start_codon:yes stop_codon:yes gene_type:complete
MDQIVGTFFAHQIAMKMFHFQTKIYSHHIVVDTYLTKYEQNFDKFMEIAQSDARLKIKEISLKINLSNDKNIDSHLNKILIFLRNIKIENELSLELATIRDDMIGEIQRLKYLMNFNQ